MFSRKQTSWTRVRTKRFRDVALPAGMEKWYTPAFDDGTWSRGKAPIGTGTWKHRRATVKNNSIGVTVSSC